MVFTQNVALEIHGKDKYRGVLADVLLATGSKVNHIFVKDGWCWWYRKYAPGNTVPVPVPPWEWRNWGKVVH